MFKANQTEVLIVTDADTFAISQTGKLTGEIALKIGSQYFPEFHWNDFAEIIVSWWIGNLENLLNGENEQEFSFMDGDFCFVISKTSDNKWLLQCAEEVPPSQFIIEEIISLSQFAREILQAAKLINNICDQQKWKVNDSQSRKKMISEFEKTLSNSRI